MIAAQKWFSRWLSRPRDLDLLINEIADHQRPEDLAEFRRRLPDLTLFLSIADPVPPNIRRDRGFLAKNGIELRMRSTEIAGMELMLPYTSAADPRIGPEYAMIDGH